MSSRVARAVRIRRFRRPINPRGNFRAGATSSFAEPNGLAAAKLSNETIDDLVVSEGNVTGPGNRTGAGAVFVFFGSATLPVLVGSGHDAREPDDLRAGD